MNIKKIVVLFTLLLVISGSIAFACCPNTVSIAVSTKYVNGAALNCGLLGTCTFEASEDPASWSVSCTTGGLACASGYDKEDHHEDASGNTANGYWMYEANCWYTHHYTGGSCFLLFCTWPTETSGTCAQNYDTRSCDGLGFTRYLCKLDQREGEENLCVVESDEVEG